MGRKQTATISTSLDFPATSLNTNHSKQSWLPQLTPLHRPTSETRENPGILYGDSLSTTNQSTRGNNHDKYPSHHQKTHHQKRSFNDQAKTRQATGLAVVLERLVICHLLIAL